MGFFDGGFSGLLGLGGSVASGASARSAASEAWRHQKELAQNKHQWEVDDLRKAGLNPILSTKFGGANPPMTPKADVPDYSQAVSSALAGAQIAKTNAETEKIKQETVKKEAFKPAWEGLKWLTETLKDTLSGNLTTGFEAGKTLFHNIKNSFRGSSAIDAKADKKATDSLIKKLGDRVNPFSSPKIPVAKSKNKINNKKVIRQLDYDLQIKSIKSNKNLSRIEKARRMQKLSRDFRDKYGYLPKVKR